MSHPTFPRAFVVQRDEDVSGISGEGVIAEGVQFSDGWVATHWLDQPPMHEPKTDVWHNKGAAPFERVHGHGGRTRILWADEVAAARHELVDVVVQAFDVPASILGPEAERAYLHRQIERALRGAALQVHTEYRPTMGLGSVPQATEIKALLPELTDAVMPIVEQLLKQRDRVWPAVSRAYQLADRWEGAHGTSMFLVRTAGAELRDVLDDSGARYGDVVHSEEKEQASEPPGVDQSGLSCVCGDPIEWMDHAKRPGWVHSPGADTTCVIARPRCPECLQQHALIPGQPPACRSLRAQQVQANRVVAAECSALHTRFTPTRECIRAAQHRGDHIDEHGFHWSDTVAVYPVLDGELQYTQLGSNDRQACPYCTGAPQFLRSELDAHVQEKHARVLAVLASGGSLDERLAEPETRCRLPHEMEG
jgi:hypothetical protein